MSFDENEYDAYIYLHFHDFLKKYRTLSDENKKIVSEKIDELLAKRKSTENEEKS